MLRRLLEQQDLHGLIAGRCCRLLFDQRLLAADEAGRRMGLAVAPAVDPVQSMAWIDGFLRGSGLILLHNEELWQILDEWVALGEDRNVSATPAVVAPHVLDFQRARAESDRRAGADVAPAAQQPRRKLQRR